MPNCRVCDSNFDIKDKFCSTCGFPTEISLLGTQDSTLQPSNPFSKITQKPELIEEFFEWAKNQYNESKKFIQERDDYKLKFENASQQLSELHSSRQKVNQDDDTTQTKRLEELETNYQQICEWVNKQDTSWNKLVQQSHILEQISENKEKALDLESKLRKLSEQRQSDIQTMAAIEAEWESLKEENNTQKEENNRIIEYFKEKIEAISLSLDKITSVNPNPPSLIPTLSTNTHTEEKYLSTEELKIINLYHNNIDNSSSPIPQEVNITERTVNNTRFREQSIFLEKSNKGKGNYWIFNQGGFNYLVPKKNLTINEYRYNTAEKLFECEGYQQGRSQQFKLIKPAKVSDLLEDEKWRLDEKGILEFHEKLGGQL